MAKAMAKKPAAKNKKSELGRKGEIVRRQVHGDAHVDRRYREADPFLKMFEDVTDEFCWGTVWARPGLNHKTRAALSLASTAAQSQAGAVKLHVKTCLRTGWTKREIGEILLRPVVPDTFMLRYHNNPDKTLETFRNLWLHTGDLGYLDDEGYLFFTGRHAHWMRCRGENVSAYEVEGIISRYPGVREVIAVGVPAPLGDEDIKAFIIAEPGAIIEPRGLVLWCRDRMAAFKLPRYVVFLEEFPRSTTKREVERHKLKALAGLEVWDAEQAFGGRGYRASAAKR